MKLTLFFAFTLSCVAQQFDYNTQIRNKPTIPHVPPYDYATEISGKPTIPHAPPYNYNTELSNLPTIPHSPPYDWLTEITGRPTVPHVPPYDYVTEITNKPAAAVVLTESDNFTWSQTPGGSLTGGISNTITLAPCPYGVKGTNTHFPIRISGGTGTAEAIETSGGTCTGDGATSGTLIFTPANSHTGAFTVATANAGILEMYFYYVSAGTTGKLKISRGTKNFYATLIIGDATATTQSTINSPCLQGAYYGGAQDQSLPITAGTIINWLGPTDGTIIKILGPIGHGCFEDLYIEGNGTAGIGLDIVHSYRFSYRNLVITGWKLFGIRSMAVDYNFSNMVNGNNSNNFENVHVWSGYGGATSRAGLFGQAVNNVNSIFDFASNIFINCSFRHDTGKAAEIRFADANTFIMTNFISGVTSVLFTDVGNGFPSSNTFYDCHTVGQVSASTAGFVPATPNVFMPLGEESSQNVALLNTFATGMTHSGKWFGTPKNLPLYHTITTNSTAIANTTTDTAFDRSFTIPAYRLHQVGTVIRIRASGKYSTTGTPTLQLAVLMGAVALAVVPPTVTGNNTTDGGWSIETDTTIRTIGATGTGINGFASGGLQNLAMAGATWQNPYILDTTATQVVTVRAKWGTANAANTAMLETMTVEIMHASTVQ